MARCTICGAPVNPRAGCSCVSAGTPTCGAPVHGEQYFSLDTCEKTAKTVVSVIHQAREQIANIKGGFLETPPLDITGWPALKDMSQSQKDAIYSAEGGIYRKVSYDSPAIGVPLVALESMGYQVQAAILGSHPATGDDDPYADDDDATDTPIVIGDPDK